MGNFSPSDQDLENDTSVLFDQFLDKHASTFPDSIAIVDVSGSMTSLVSETISALDVAIALGIVISWKAEGPHAKKFITFSQTSDIVPIVGDTWLERIRNISNSKWAMNTNLQAAFNNILEAGLDVKRLFVISDMQFDLASRGQTNFEDIRKKYLEAGKTLPQIVFWNVSPRCGDVPVQHKEDGTVLLSGFSTAVVKRLYEDPNGALDINPQAFLELVINNSMYDNVLYIS
jgi:hypothetical protein